MQQIDCIFLDFSKAFDKVPHERLLLKLHYYGVRGKLLSWIRDFLSQRTQQVILEGKKSNVSNVTSGVPQGTVTKFIWDSSQVYPETVRDYWVYVPAQYDEDRPTAVMVFQDGQNFIRENGDWRTPIVFDNLIHKGRMPVTIGIIRGRMPTLEIIHDRFVRMFRLSLSTSLRKVVDISVRSTELIKFGEFLKTLPVPSSMNLFRMTPLRGNAIMVLETRLVFTLIDMFFGGNGELEVKAEGREFTEIESRMIKRVIISALEDLQSSWRPVFPVQINYARAETNPQFVAIVPHSEIVIVVTFDVEIGRAPMSVTLCVPYSMIEPVRSRLNAGFQSEQDEKDNTWSNRFTKNLNMSHIELVALLGQTELTVRDFLNLQQDDLIYLEHETQQPISILANGIEKFRGFQGSYKGHKAINVSKLVYVPPTVDEILGA